MVSYINQSRKFKNPVGILLLFLAIIVLISIISSKSNAEGTGNFPAPDNGDWVIQNETTVWNETIILSGNLSIENGGELIFLNVSLYLNCTNEGQYYIEVKDSGKFSIVDNDNDNSTTNDASNITSYNESLVYNFYVRNNTEFIMKNSFLSNCGYWDKNNSEKLGLYINSDNVLIEHNNFSRNYGAICLILTDPNISNNTFWNNSCAIYLKSSNATIENNTIFASNKGIYCDYYSSPTITNNNIFYNSKGIYCIDNSNPVINLNDIIENSIGIHSVKNCTPKITFNDILNNDIGIKCSENSRPLIKTNKISFNNDNGIYCEGNSNATIDFNTILNNREGIYCDSSSPTIVNNGILNNNQAIYCKSSNPYIEDNIISNNIYGIICWYSTPEIKNNILTNNTFGLDIPYNSKNTIIKISNTFVNEIDIRKCYYLNEENKTIENRSFDLKYYKGSITAQGLITLYDCKNITILNCELSNNEYGIYSYSSSINIINNILDNNENGLYCKYGDLEIINNTISNNSQGISCWYIDPIITKNQFYKNNDAVSFWYSDSILLKNNFIENEYAIYLKSSNIYISNSTILDSEEYDIYLEDDAHLTAVNTTFDKDNIFIKDVNSNLTVKWFLNVKVINIWHNPFQNINVHIIDNKAKFEKTYITDSKGLVKWIECIDFIENSTNREFYIPYTINVSKYWSWNDTSVTVDRNKEITIILEIEKKGDWIVTGKEIYWNDTIILTGNLTVKNGGNLTFHNITLLVNNSFDGEYGILVENGGEFNILDYDKNSMTENDRSNITAVNPEFEYKFLVDNGSLFEMKNSELSECGYMPGEDGKMGLTIKSNNTEIKNSSFYNNKIGIYIFNSTKNQISNNNFSFNIYGIYLYSSINNSIAYNNFTNNDYGIILITTNNLNNIKNNSFSNNIYGIYLGSSSNYNQIENNKIYNNNLGIKISLSFNNKIIKNNITINEEGIYLSRSNDTIIENNSVSVNYIGIILSKSNNNKILNNKVFKNNCSLFISRANKNQIINTTITNSLNFDFNITNSQLLVINTSFNKSKVNITPDSKLKIKYYLNIIVENQSKIPIKNANVRVMEKEKNGFDKIYKTNKEGFVKWIECTEYIQTGEIKEYYTPHSIIATDNASYNSTDVFMNQSQTILLILDEVTDWVVTNVEIRKNETIILNGNLTIENAGFLEFQNVTLLMNCKNDGQYHIEVKSGGTFLIYDNDENNETSNDSSIISAFNEDYEYVFWIRRWSTVVMKNSELHECGYESHNKGLIIESDDVIFDKNLISNNYCGLFIDSGDPIIINNTIKNNNQGIYLVNNSSTTITNNKIWKNDNTGIRIEYCSAKISGNQIFENTNGIYCFYSDIVVIDTNINNNDYGLINEFSNSTFINCEISYTNNGLNSYKSTISITNSSFFNCTNYDINLIEESIVESINTLFEKVNFEDEKSSLINEWFLDIKIIDQNDKPGNNTSVHIWDNKNGTFAKTYYTDNSGWIRGIILVEYIQNKNSKIFYTPHNIDARNGSYQNYIQTIMDENKIKTIYLGYMKDWIVRYEEIIVNETILLNGNLIIEEEGSLTFRNVTLIMNCSEDGENGIEVLKGGKFYIFDYDENPHTENDMSKITANNKEFVFKFLVNEDSIFKMKNSELSECGYEGENTGTGGLTISTDNVIIDNSSFYHNYYGIYLYRSNNNQITHNKFYSNTNSGIYLRTSQSNEIINNEINSNIDTGIYIKYSNNNQIINNSVSQCKNGIELLASQNVKINDNIVFNNDKVGILINDNNNLVTNNHIFDNDQGILITGGNNRITMNYIYNNYEGIFIDFEDNNIIIDSNITDNEYGVVLDYANNILIINSIIKNSGVYDFDLDTHSNITVINSIFDDDKISLSLESSMVIKYYLDILVNDSIGNPISNAKIVIKDNENGTFEKTFYTGANGWVESIECTKYTQKGILKTNYTPHELNVEKGESKKVTSVTMDKSKKIYLTLDIQPPEIKNVNFTVSDTTATITWETNEPSTSKVLYALKTDYDLNESEDSLVYFHTINLNDLEAESIYIFSIISIDESGNSNQSEDFEFTTGKETIPPHQIENLKARDLGIGGVIELTWDPSEADDFDYYIIYQSTTDAKNVKDMKNISKLLSRHDTTENITGLTNGIRYYFAVTAVDKNGNENNNVTVVKITPTIQHDVINIQVKKLKFPKKGKVGEIINISFQISNEGYTTISNLSIEVFFGDLKIYNDTLPIIYDYWKISFDWEAEKGNEKIKIVFYDLKTGKEIGETFESEEFLKVEEDEKGMSVEVIIVILIIGVGIANILWKNWKEGINKPKK